jgi:peptidoglycan hydrolase CwlO-like protein
MLFGAMIQNAKLVVLVLLVAAAFAYRAVLIHQRNSARAQVTTLTAAAAVLQADNTSMAASVAKQNAAVEALQAKMRLTQNDATHRQAQYAAAAAQAMARELAHSNAIKSAPIPAGCQSAIDWGNAQGPELGRW